MRHLQRPGLGELLRYVAELVEQGAEEQYRRMGLEYRPRFTPVMRALAAGAETVTDVTKQTRLTQGAVSQTVKLMGGAGLVERYGVSDGRKSGLRLTRDGRDLARALEPQWEATFTAIGELENEIGYPLLTVLQETANALDRQGFGPRLAAANDARIEAVHG